MFLLLHGEKFGRNDRGSKGDIDMSKEGRRDFLRKGFFVILGGVISFFGLKNLGRGIENNKELSPSKEAMHWNKLAG